MPHAYRAALAAVAFAVIAWGPACDRGRPGPGEARDVRPPTTPAAVPADPHADWTHKELLAHLNGKGLGFTSVFAPGPGNRPAAEFGVGEWPDRKTVYVVLAADPRDAREVAGSFGRDAFHWKRFAFDSRDAAILARVRAALP